MSVPAPHFALLVAGLAAVDGCGGCRHGAPKGGGTGGPGAATSADSRTGPGSTEHVLTLVATAEVRGTPEPCGCQAEPLGDVARAATLLDQAKQQANRAWAGRGGALLVDAGGLRYGADRLPPERRAQAELKAEFLERAWQELGAAVALGDEDLALGPDRVPPGRRLCSNLKGIAIAPPSVRDVGGIRVGLFGLIDPTKEEAWHAAGLEATDPAEAARAAVATLRGQGAQVIVALAHLARPAARRLAHDVPGITVVVAGDETGDDGGEPERVGETLVVQPAHEARKVAWVELHLVGGRLSTALVAGGPERAASLARLDKRIDRVGRELAALAADPSADPSFVRAKEAEAARLRREREQARTEPPAPAGPYATARLVRVTRDIPRDPGLAAKMKQLDVEVGEANRSAAQKVPPPPPLPGEARYVGVDACADCHAEAVTEWRSTVHARAWRDLVAAGKQWSYDCINCHVAGYGRPGGSAMAHVDGLEAVQCEACHGPGSLHAARPEKLKLRNPVEADCRDCHTKEHSDTFQYQPYLRDVVGPGHGARRRHALGPGVTAHELRHEAGGHPPH